MKKEEMAKAYADGYNKEYQQIAYDSFLCGYGAKCDTELPEDLDGEIQKLWESLCPRDEGMGSEYADNIGVEQFFDLCHNIAQWQKEQMMKGAVEGDYDCQYATPAVFFDNYLDGVKDGDKVKIIIVKED